MKCEWCGRGTSVALSKNNSSILLERLTNNSVKTAQSASRDSVPRCGGTLPDRTQYAVLSIIAIITLGSSSSSSSSSNTATTHITAAATAIPPPHTLQHPIHELFSENLFSLLAYVLLTVHLATM